MFLLDTNVVSELRKVGDGKADANVVAWITATAIIQGMTVVTGNVTDFETTGIAVFDPWTAMETYR